VKVEQQQLASGSIDALDQFLGDHYLKLSEDLNTSLAGASMDTSPQDAAKNKQLLDNITSLFPVSDTGYFEASTPTEVRRLQSGLVWQRRYIHDYDYALIVAEPAYLLGAHKYKGRTDLLLHRPGNSKAALNSQVDLTEMFMAKGIPAKRVSSAREVMDGWLRSPLDEEEMSLMFKDGLYKVHPDTAASVMVTAESPWQRHKLKQAGHTVLKASGAGYPPVEAISDHSLARFNVFDHIAHLAVTFGLAQEVKTVIEEHTPDK
jgi:hypothetical protein